VTVYCPSWLPLPICWQDLLPSLMDWGRAEAMPETAKRPAKREETMLSMVRMGFSENEWAALRTNVKRM
jgi:hypothetical protein